MIDQYSNYYWKRAGLHVCRIPVIESRGALGVFGFFKSSFSKSQHTGILGYQLHFS